LAPMSYNDCNIVNVKLDAPVIALDVMFRGIRETMSFDISESETRKFNVYTRHPLAGET